MVDFKIAYLILAHQQPQQLARLIARLESPRAYFFIHIDKKCNAQPFQDALKEIKGAKLFWVVERAIVRWGGWSLVQATLKTIRTALDQKERFKYLCLLSGSCYPIKPLAQIESVLDSSNTEFIHVHHSLFTDREERIKNHFFYDSPFFNPLTVAYKLFYLPVRVIRKTINILARRAYPFSLFPWKGGQFWCLTEDCVRYVLEFLEAHPDFVKFFETMYAPDEAVFQTIICDSDYSEKISSPTQPLRIAIWNRPDGTVKLLEDHDAFEPMGEYLTGPNVLTESDWKYLRESRAFFARKFDEKKSAPLLDKIDREIHHLPV